MNLSRATSAVLGLLMLTPVAVSAAASPAHADTTPGTVYVSSTADASVADGTRTHPYASLKQVVDASNAGRIAPGTTARLAHGTYHDGGLLIARTLSITSDDPARPAVITGANVEGSWRASGSTWESPATHAVLAHDAITDKSADGLRYAGTAALPEQVFLDGKPLTQVATRAEVGPGRFYVDQHGISPRTSDGSKATGASYVLGDDPSGHKVEIVDEAKLAVVNAPDSTISDVVIEKYSPTMESYGTPKGVSGVSWAGAMTGQTALMLQGDRDAVTGSTIRYVASGAAVAASGADGGRISDNAIMHSQMNAVGINRVNGFTVSGNLAVGANEAGFDTTRGKLASVVGFLKATHSENIRITDNVFDDRSGGVDHSSSNGTATDRTKGVWLDESARDSVISDNAFYNVPVSIVDEVGGGSIIASNIIDSSFNGILISASDHDKVVNNTIADSTEPLVIREDGRRNGYNLDASGKEVAESYTRGLKPTPTWDTRGTVVVNNLFGAKDATAGTNANGTLNHTTSNDVLVSGGHNNYVGNAPSTVPASVTNDAGIWANDEVSSIDYNGYERLTSNGRLTNPYAFAMKWNYNDHRSMAGYWDSVVNPGDLARLGDHVKGVSGLEAHSVSSVRDTDAASSIFVHEAPSAGNLGGVSDLRLKDGSPAVGAGHYLLGDTAAAIGVTASKDAVNLGALRNAAWDGVGAKESPVTSLSAQADIDRAKADASAHSSKPMSTHWDGKGSMTLTLDDPKASYKVGDTLSYTLSLTGDTTYAWQYQGSNLTDGSYSAVRWFRVPAGATVTTVPGQLKHVITQADADRGFFQPALTMRFSTSYATPKLGSLTVNDDHCGTDGRVVVTR